VNNILFISGIDTGAGKTYATGWLARELARGGVRTVTQKPVQTGCTIVATASSRCEENQRLEAVATLPDDCDIIVHREIMGCGILPEDREGLTAPVLLPYPASPHLAAKLANTDWKVCAPLIDAATRTLAERYDVVLVEGAGGLMTPLSEDTGERGRSPSIYLTIDFIRERGYPVVFVTSGKLGSINHTLLSFDAMRSRGIRLHTLLYNSYPESDPIITADTERLLRRVVARDWPGADFKNVPLIQTP